MTGKLKYISYILAFLLPALSILGCTQTEFGQVPDYEQVPQVLNLEKMLADFKTDYISANEKYAGNIYLFPSVSVDAVSTLYANPRATTFYLQAGQVKFAPKFSLDVESIGPGYVVDIVGMVRAWAPGSFHFVDNCSFVIVEGGQLPPPGGY